MNGTGEAVNLFAIVIAGLLLENAIFTRGLGVNKSVSALSGNRVLWHGGFVTYLTFVSTALAWPVNWLLRGWGLQSTIGMRYYTALGALLCVCLVFTTTVLIVREYSPRVFYVLREQSNLVLLNSTVLGTIMLSFGNGHGYLTSLVFAFFSGVGYLGALMLLHESRQRISLSNVPRSFRGLPILLLYAGIFSLALYGLIGHQLPT